MSIRDSANHVSFNNPDKGGGRHYRTESQAIQELINRFKEPFQISCERCNGTGLSSAKANCETCKGSGKIFIDFL